MAVPQEVRLNVHGLVHRSKMFSLTGVASAVVDGASVGLVINVADEDLHTVGSVVSGGSARIMFYEGPTITASTPVSIINMNRENPVASTACAGDAVAFTGGTVIFNGHIPGGGKITGGGGAVRASTEWIFAKNTTYVLAACNLQGATVGISFNLQFYEH